MNKIRSTIGVLLTVVLCMTSCLGDDKDTVVAYSDVAITQVELGTLNRYSQTISSKTGNDTVVKTALTGSAYAMTIDHLSGRIYNQDSLPVGTDVAHVLLTVSAKNGGYVFLKSLTSDSLQRFGSTDSLDFTQPRTLVAYSSDASWFREYVMTLNVSKTTGVSFGWKRMGQRPELAGWTDKVLVAWGDSVALTESGVVTKGEQAFRVTADQRLQSSTDLSQWNDVPANTSLQQMIGAGTRELFALGSDGRIKRSVDDGLTWTDERLDDDASLLPATNLASVCWPYTQANNTDYILLAGCRADDTDVTVLWRKLSQYDAAGGGQWIYMPYDANNSEPLPWEQGLSLAWYDGVVLALGSDMTVRRSRDQGITWQASSTYALPSSLEGTAARMATDRQGRLWVVTNVGQVWQGHRQ